MTSPAYIQLDGKDTLRALSKARENLPQSEGELVLDFSSVKRMDPAVLQGLEELACAAEEQARLVTLRGLKVEVYKVLKLAKLSSRFSVTN